MQENPFLKLDFPFSGIIYTMSLNKRNSMNNLYKFTGKAEIYSKYRPSYPDAFLDELFEYIRPVRESVLVEIGSGTGILTEALLKRHNCVIAVEPNEDMRSVAERRLAGYPGFVSHTGTAEHTLLEEHCADLVIAAQAFHWFDPDAFREECRRILKPGAPVVLVWNMRDRTAPIILENAEICRRYCPDFHGFSGNNITDELIVPFFRPGTCRIREFENPQYFDRESFIGRNLSSSYAPVAGSEGRDAFTADLAELFDRMQDGSGKILIRHVTRCYFGMV